MWKRRPEKKALPQLREPLAARRRSDVCGHLEPVLDALEAAGTRVAEVDAGRPGGWRIAVLDTFLHQETLFNAFQVPDFVTWEWADPHYGVGNSLNCGLCCTAIEGRFDARDPSGTLGRNA